MKTLPYLILILLCASCATVQPHEKADHFIPAFVGSDANQVIRGFGPPDRVFSDGESGVILHYDYSYQSLQPGVTYSQGTADWQTYLYGDGSVTASATTLSRPPSSVYHQRYAQFYINEDGRCYHTRHNVISQREAEVAQKNKQTSWIVGLIAISALAIAAIAVDSDY